MKPNRVIVTLLVLALAATLLLPFANLAENRLVTGTPYRFWSALTTGQLVAALALLVSLTGMAVSWYKRPVLNGNATLVCCLCLLLLVIYAAGDFARRSLEDAGPAARVSLSSAFWAQIFCLSLMMIDVLQRMTRSIFTQVFFALFAFAAVMLLFFSGALDQLSIMREYANRQEAFAGALVQHMMLVVSALGPALVIGVPLGVLALRRLRLRSGLFSTLNVFQTVPSIALFGLLVAPLSALGEAVPLFRELGIRGIGSTPAIIALVLYALLPIARNTYAGFAQVPTAAIEAAQGMGMTPQQILWRIEVPLALPVLLSGLRIVVVQSIGLAVVAALIGAGGLGTFVFNGLGQYAIDLVLLGAIPTIILAVLADCLLQLLVSLSRRKGVT
ncbi:MAG: ABC transporter permease [Pseudomonadota bacterium]